MSATALSYSVELLGKFTVVGSGRELDLGPGGERLVALLAIHGRPVPRQLIAGSLWPDCTESRALANLRSTLYRMTPESADMLVSSQRWIRLSAGVDVDLQSAKIASNRILAGAPQETDLGPAVQGLLREDVLPYWYEDDWMVQERESFRQLRLHALEESCVLLADRGRSGQAVASGLAAVAAEPLRESAHRALITAHLRESNYGEAVAQYRRCARLLCDELGVEPSPALRELVTPQAGSGQPVPISSAASRHRSAAARSWS